MSRTFHALTVFLLAVLLGTFMTTITASISVEELKEVARENKDSKPMGFSTKGPQASEGSATVPRRKLSREGIKDDILTSPDAVVETNDMERNHLRH